MAPHADTDSSDVQRLPPPTRPPMSTNPPRFIIIGAGSRGSGYARAINESTNGLVAGVVEPITYKRRRLGAAHIWGSKSGPSEGQEFSDWRDFVTWEEQRRIKASHGESVPEGVDGVLICVQDEMHKEVILGVAPLGLHIMCEKPLATSLQDCVDIYRALLPNLPDTTPDKIFSIGHVLRYSPHNMLLRKLLLEERVIGDIVSIEHTEPVGWWHFSHSYVRGNWRNEARAAPSLLTKSCHDVDLLLWLLCSPPPNSPNNSPHIPSTVSSSGAVRYFNQSRKPAQAGNATNCLSCAHEPDCKFSAKKIYLGSAPWTQGLGTGNTDWPVSILVPEIEQCIAEGGIQGGEAAVLAELKKDYDETTPADEVQAKNWFGRCVWDADNDVCDDQFVTLTWDNDPLTEAQGDRSQALVGRASKSATLHMVAFTKKICERYSHIYGTDGEIHADSSTIRVEDFNTGESKVHYPHIAGGGHGGGDDGLMRQFVLAVDRVKNAGMEPAAAQKEYVGCTLEEVIRSHAMVFAADEARTDKTVVDWKEWWNKEVENKLMV